jgi:hydrogenase maturation protease
MTLIAGLGSPHGDDQLGWVVVDHLRPILAEDLAVCKVSTALELLDCLESQDTAIVIDSVAPSGRPGTVRTVTWPCPELAALTPWSTHSLGLVEALQLAEVLGRLPRRVTIHTIEAQATAPGASLSRLMMPAIEAVVKTVLGELRGFAHG